MTTQGGLTMQTMYITYTTLRLRKALATTQGGLTMQTMYITDNTLSSEGASDNAGEADNANHVYNR